MMDYNDAGYYTIKDSTWLDNQRIAGKVLSKAIQEMSNHLFPGISTKELNDRYLNGYTIDYDDLDFSNIKGCHQEIKMVFKK